VQLELFPPLNDDGVQDRLFTIVCTVAVIVPPLPVTVIAEPSAVAPKVLLTAIAVVEAAAFRITLTVATTPLDIRFVLSPARMQL
jgi:hypothetical protein